MSQPSQLTIFVAPDGNDGWSGNTPDPSDNNQGPLATLQTARDRARSLRKEHPEAAIDICMADGDYELADTITFDNRDSGTSEAPLTIRSANPRMARLIGGRILDRPVSPIPSATLDRIPLAAREHIVSFDLSATPELNALSARGFGREPHPAHTELYCDHKRLTLSRYPDAGTEAAIFGTPASNDDDHGGEIGDLTEGFLIDDDRPLTWASYEDVWIHGYWAWDWADTYERIAGIDPETLHLKTHSPYGVYGFRSGQPFHYLNIPEELDSPGEYFIDPDGIAYAWLPTTDTDSETAISTLETPLLSFVNASHISIEGLTLEYGCGDAVRISHGSDVSLPGLTVRNIGNSGIVIDQGHRHTVTSCGIYNIGETAIDVAGGDRAALERCNHAILNNHIHHFAEWVRCYRPGIKVAGVGVRIANNHIHDAPHNAVLLSGNEHLIEKNHIHDVCYETGDSGAFYMGRDWTERGNVIRYNRIHDTLGHGLGSRAIYLDDCASGTVVHGNIFYNCTMAVFIGGGRNHRVTNNIFVDCEPALVIDGRGASEKEVWKQMVNDIMHPRFEAMNPLEPPYSVRYPDLKEVAAYYFHELGVPPEGNLVSRNICIGEWLQVREPAFIKQIALQLNFTDGDPGFTDTPARDFHLPPDAEVFELGFKPIPLDEIGLYTDRFRNENL
jgi:parallel beta-helix repeat protein